MRSVIAVVLMWAPTVGPAATWLPVAQCGEGDRVRYYSYDPQSIRNIGAARSVEIRGDFSHHRASQAKGAHLRWTVDCAARTFSELSRKEYGQAGKLLQQYDLPTPAMPISGDSVAEKVLAAVCA